MNVVAVMGSPFKENKQLAYDTNAKVNPPLRSKEAITALIQGLKDGTIDAIATDHAPHTLVDKMCEFGLAAFGISGLETAFACLMTLVHSKQLDLNTLISKLTCGPGKIIGTRFGELGRLKPGCRADITIFNPDEEWIVDSGNFVSKGKNTPYDGYPLKGKIHITLVAGQVVYKS